METLLLLMIKNNNYIIYYYRILGFIMMLDYLPKNGQLQKGQSLSLLFFKKEIIKSI